MEFYSIGQMAGMAGVSVRTLRYYDKHGLLSPSHRTEAGYRRYNTADLIRLQYILALKFLGFSLEELKKCLVGEPAQLSEKLAQQQAMMREKRDHLDRVIRAIEQAENLLRVDKSNAESIRHVIEVMQVNQKPQWIDKYMTVDQRRQMRELMEKSYSAEELRTLMGRGWDEENHRKHLNRYHSFRAELKRLVETGADPASPEAQQLADRLSEMNERFSQGNPAILSGMRRTWENYNAVPADQRVPGYSMDEREIDFIKRAMTIRIRLRMQEK